MRTKLILCFLLALVAGTANAEEDYDPVELCAITPAPGVVEAVPTEWVITYGGKKLSVVEDAEVKLTCGETEYPLYIMLDEEDDTKVIVSFDGRPITTPGEWVISIPGNTISIEGTPIADPQSFRYTVKSDVDYTINPEEGVVDGLQRFTISFNNYMIELNEEEAAAYLINTETESEVQASAVEEIAGGKGLYVELPYEVTEPGTYQLIIADATVKNMATDRFLPEMAFNYTIKAEEVDPVELCAIDPAPGIYDALPTEWVITYGGKKLSVVEDAEVKLTCGETEYPLYIMLDEEDDTKVIVSFDGRPITTPGEWVISIPGNTISIEGTPIADPQSFRYTVKSDVDYTINPEEGVVDGLQRFTISFNNYMIELNEEEAAAYLINTETESEVQASAVEEIAGGKGLYVELPYEVTEPGTYQLIIADATVKNMATDRFLPEMAFNYTIKAEEVDPVELCAIDPAPGIYDALPTEWVITYGGKKLSVVEDAEVKLTCGETEYPLYIMLDEEDDTKVIVSFDGRPITTPGEWVISIPGNTISIEGTPIADPQSFRYTVKSDVDYTINPEEGVVDGLQRFTISFNNYMIELNEEEAAAYLINTETESEVQASAVEEIAGGKGLYVELPYEVTEPGSYQLIIADATVKNMATDRFLPELAFNYTIKAEEVDPVELCAIDPAPGIYDALPTEWVITYGGKKLSVVEDAEVKLTCGETEYPLYIMLDEEDDTKVIVSFDGRPITTPGEWVISIPGNTISIEGTPIADPQSFRYTVKSDVDYTINPEEGVVDGLQRFTISFNNYMIELNEEEAAAYLINTETESEVQASAVEEIAGGKGLYVELPYEVTEPGTYQLIIADATVKNMATDRFLPELAFNYTIKAEEVDPVELCAIDPAPGIYDALPTEWVITYGGKKLSVVEDAEVKLTCGETEYPLYIMLDEEDDTKVIVSFDGRPITTPGEWVISIPGNTISIEGTPIADPQSFRYTVKSDVDYTINPEEGEVESLQTFIITFNNYMIELNEEEATAFLINIDTENEVQAIAVEEIAGGKGLYIELPNEVTEPGNYQLIIADASVKNMATDRFLPELAFNYTIKSTSTSIKDAKTAKQQINIYNLQGQKIKNIQKGLYIVNGKKVVRK